MPIMVFTFINPVRNSIINNREHSIGSELNDFIGGNASFVVNIVGIDEKQSVSHRTPDSKLHDS